MNTEPRPRRKNYPQLLRRRERDLGRRELDGEIKEATRKTYLNDANRVLESLLVASSEEEIQKMRKAVEPVIQNFMKDMEAKGFKKAEMEAQLQYIYERIAYWGKQEKDRKLKSPYLQ